MHFPEPTITQEFLAGFYSIWRLWVPLLVLLVCMGWATRRWWGGRLLLLSLVVLVIFTTRLTLREHAKERATLDAWNKLRVPLPQVATIDGLQLAAGTMVRWDVEQPGHLLTADLGAGQEVGPGLILTGEVEHKYVEFWRGTLAKESLLRGWLCARGKIDLYNSGELRWCRIASPQKTPAGEVPAQTAILLDPDVWTGTTVHLPGVGMRAYPGGIWIPPDAWFGLYSDGELMSLSGPRTLRGVKFEAGVTLRYGAEDVTLWFPTPQWAPLPAHPSGQVTGWRGDLMEPLTCQDGQMIPAGSRATIPVTGDLVTTTHWESHAPHAKPILDSFHCTLGPTS